jgi:hypothetical protein
MALILRTLTNQLVMFLAAAASTCVAEINVKN